MARRQYDLQRKLLRIWQWLSRYWCLQQHHHQHCLYSSCCWSSFSQDFHRTLTTTMLLVRFLWHHHSPLGLGQMTTSRRQLKSKQSQTHYGRKVIMRAYLTTAYHKINDLFSCVNGFKVQTSEYIELIGLFGTHYIMQKLISNLYIISRNLNAGKTYVENGFIQLKVLSCLFSIINHDNAKNTHNPTTYKTLFRVSH